MPNLRPPVTTTALALAYRDRIVAALPRCDPTADCCGPFPVQLTRYFYLYSPIGSGSNFQPLMTLYLTDLTSPEEIRTAKASGAVFACKLYPQGATTNSDSGVTDVRRVAAALEAMAECGMPLLVHSEVVPTFCCCVAELAATTWSIKLLLRVPARLWGGGGR